MAAGDSQGVPVSLHSAHDTAHGYIGGGIAFEHHSFRDPFVFLLHSYTDRLLAMWQRTGGNAWRLDPSQMYGAASLDHSCGLIGGP